MELSPLTPPEEAFHGAPDTPTSSAFELAQPEPFVFEATPAEPERTRLDKAIGYAKALGGVAVMGVVAYSSMRYGGGGHEYVLSSDTTPMHSSGAEAPAAVAEGLGLLVGAGVGATAVGMSIAKVRHMRRYRQAAARRVAAGGPEDVNQQRAITGNEEVRARQARIDPTATGQPAYGGRRTGRPELYSMPDPANPSKKIPVRPGWIPEATRLPSSTYGPTEKILPIHRETPSWWQAFLNTSWKEPKHRMNYSGQRNKSRWYHRGP